MQEPHLQITRRNLPHWTLEGSIYFVTFRSMISPFSEEERLIILNHLRTGHGTFYSLAATMVMPDHAHVLLRPFAGIELSRILKGIKGVSAKLINQRRGSTGKIWQEESWDRIVRDAAEFEQKLQYLIQNPVKAGLVKDVAEYFGWWFNPEFA